MHEGMITMPGGVWIGVIIFIGVILFIVCMKVLQRIPLFQGPTSTIMAICVSLLAILGLWRFCTQSQHSIWMEGILLLYVTLATSILFVFFLWIIDRLRRKRRDTDSPAAPRHTEDALFRKDRLK